MRSIGKKNKEIAEVCGFCEQFITDLVRDYCANGLDSILHDRRTSNNRRMTLAEEEVFLSQFHALAESGQIITVSGILQKFEEATGKPSNTSTIYNLLKRHGWRKVVKPRPEHPNKASETEIEASKKLTFPTGKSKWKYIT